MDPIREIIWHEEQALGPDEKVSEHRWEAARLIWQVLQDGMGQRELARAIGKHHNHVRWMAKSWEICGSRIPEVSDRPPFNEIYHSVEVRGESADPARSQAASGGSARTASRDHAVTEEEEKPTPATWLRQADEALTLLEQHTAFWPLLERADIQALIDLNLKIRRITTAVRKTPRASS